MRDWGSACAPVGLATGLASAAADFDSAIAVLTAGLQPHRAWCELLIKSISTGTTALWWPSGHQTSPTRSPRNEVEPFVLEL